MAKCPSLSPPGTKWCANSGSARIGQEMTNSMPCSLDYGHKGQHERHRNGVQSDILTAYWPNERETEVPWFEPSRKSDQRYTNDQPVDDWDLLEDVTGFNHGLPSWEDLDK